MGVGVAIGAVLAAGQMMQARSQGKRADRQAKEAFQQQERAQAQAVSAAGSKRLQQAAAQRALQKKKPNAAKILAKKRAAAKSGIASTFLTGPSGNPNQTLGGSYSLGD